MSKSMIGALIKVGDNVYDTEQAISGVVNAISSNGEVVVEVNEEWETVSKMSNLVKISSKEGSMLIGVDVAKDGNEDHSMFHTLYDCDDNLWWNWVREFQLAFNHPAPDMPTMLTKERIEKRNSWMLEECEEMLEAETLTDQVDAAIDKLYFALGDLVELGVKPYKLLEIVQNANMGKLHNIDGKMVPVYKADGKVQKPDNWEEDFAPEGKLKAEILRQQNLERGIQ